MSKIIYFDGSCLPVNPGGYGFSGCVAVENGKEIKRLTEFVGNKSTNNVAEWNGLINALELAKELGWDKVKILGDSQLVVNQFNNLWNINAEHLLKFYNKAKKLSKKLKARVHWVPRKENLADKVVHEAYVEFMEEKHKEKAKKEKDNYKIEKISESIFEVKNLKNGNIYNVSIEPKKCSCVQFKKMANYSLHKRSNIKIGCKHIFLVKEYLKNSQLEIKIDEIREVVDRLLKEEKIQINIKKMILDKLKEYFEDSFDNLPNGFKIKINNLVLEEEFDKNNIDEIIRTIDDNFQKIIIKDKIDIELIFLRKISIDVLPINEIQYMEFKVDVAK